MQFNSSFENIMMDMELFQKKNQFIPLDIILKISGTISEIYENTNNHKNNIMEKYILPYNFKQGMQIDCDYILFLKPFDEIEKLYFTPLGMKKLLLVYSEAPNYLKIIDYYLNCEKKLSNVIKNGLNKDYVPKCEIIQLNKLLI